MARGGVVGAAVVCVLLVAGCSPVADEPGPASTTAGPAMSEAEGTPDSTAATPGDATGPVTATVTTVARDLPAPWGLAPLPDGRFLVTLRDEARVVVVGRDGTVTPVTGAGADQLRAQTVPQGEGGLLGVAVAPGQGRSASDLTVYLYRTGHDDNAVVRGSFDANRAVLGELTTVLDGIASAGNHNGGRLAFGPDGMLYVTTGDAGYSPLGQDPESLGGKILRITPDGDPAPGNPALGGQGEASPVWSLGHRNVQGIGWDAAGNMLASEFGQDTWDELNVILPGHNYGWPVVEGAGDQDGEGAATGQPLTGPLVQDGFTRPLMVWPTSEASPSGLAVTADAVYLASLRGARLWRVPLLPAESGAASEGGVQVGPAQALVTDQGRLRAVVADDDGTLWVLTNNTDGRGGPRDGDDRLLHVVITPE